MKKTFLLFAALVTGISLPGAIELADNGQTAYTIVGPEKPSGEEREAVRDLRYHLGIITGAGFQIGKAGAKNIFVGTKAPSDNKPLGRYERRIRNENGNIYLYGNGIQGNTFAVYDFLEQFLGCQWYSFFGDIKIPKRQKVAFDEKELKRDIVPSFNSFSYNGNVYTIKGRRFRAFRRRARIYDYNCPDGSFLQSLNDSHTPATIIPSGYMKPGQRKPVRGPHRLFRDKAYHKTDPKFFSLNKRGKRDWKYQLCYSNKSLRREMIKNYQLIIDTDYKGGEAIMHCDLNDKGKYGMPVCYCKECAKLNKKYGDPSGSYYDALIEIANHFLVKYPKIRFKMTAYQLTRDVPSKFKGKFPRNVLIHVAALDETDFLKPYQVTPSADRMFKMWSKVSGGELRCQLYPTVYQRPLFTRPLAADIHRLTANLRYLHKLGFSDLTAEFGVGPQGTAGFNEMRLYLIARLANDITLDEKELIRDFMFHYYGEKAAPLMLKYYYELEECEKNEKRFMRWWPDHRSCLTYLTPENLLRWQGYFDEMLKVSDPATRQYLNIRRARLNLDEATMSVWYKFAPGQMPDRDMLLKRHTADSRANSRDLTRNLPDKKEAATNFRKMLRHDDRRPIFYHYCMAGKWKPLPEPFASMPEKNILRTLLYVNRKALVEDREAAAGIATFEKKEIPKELTFDFGWWEKTNVMHRESFPTTIKVEDIKKAKGYNFYHIGSSRLYPDTIIFMNVAYSSGVLLGYLYDEKDPEQLYDFYISVKYDHRQKALMADQFILVKKEGKEETRKKKSGDRIDDPGQFA